MYKKELTIAKKAVLQAGAMLKKEFLKKKNPSLQFKKNNERVTAYDKKAEKIILSILKKEFPNYQILSEEGGGNKNPNDLCWVIDPLDGTTNFTINHPLFCVAIALFKKNEVVLGVIYNPILDELYWAIKGQGAFKNKQRLKVSKQKDLKKSVLTYCHGSGEKNTQKAYKLYQRFHNLSRHCRHFGCTQLELAMVAAGNTQAHLVSGGKIWDIAAGALIVKEAGGTVTDWQNRPWNKKSSSILAAPSQIQRQCLRELKKLKLS
ncbi:MAG: inositol monophosphatase family protein [Patescibacteria group bacterium]|nr:inositol monophosphatase family protein [Patescibacteria group bacterium]